MLAETSNDLSGERIEGLCLASHTSNSILKNYRKISKSAESIREEPCRVTISSLMLAWYIVRTFSQKTLLVHDTFLLFWRNVRIRKTTYSRLWRATTSSIKISRYQIRIFYQTFLFVYEIFQLKNFSKSLCIRTIDRRPALSCHISSTMNTRHMNPNFQPL